jgi:hypothetical protein
MYLVLRNKIKILAKDKGLFLKNTNFISIILIIILV